MTKYKIKIAEWVLRIAVAGEFIGHGVFALQGKEGWFKYFNAVGIVDEQTIITIDCWLDGCSASYSRFGQAS